MTVQCRCFNRVNGRTCFARKSLAKPPALYSAPHYMPRCPTCGARKWAIDKYRIRTELRIREKCWCTGYPVLSSKGAAHTKGSKYCVHHPHGIYNQAKREGVSDADIPFEHIGRKCGDECPF